MTAPARPPLRVTFLVPSASYDGGVRVVALHAAALQRRGHSVHIVGRPSFRPVPLKQRIKGLLQGRGWVSRKAVPRGPYFDDLGLTFHTLDGYRAAEDRDVPDADVVVATWWSTVEWAAALSASKGTKVHFMQDYEVWGHGADRARIDAAVARPYPKLVVAGWVRDLLRERFNFTDVTHVPNCVDHTLFHAEPRGKRPRPTIGLLYTIMRNKGIDIALKAIDLARKEVPDLHVVAFSGKLRPTPEFPLPEGADFRFGVPDDELRLVYSSCDAWLFPTRKEGYGLPILEAMACRTPVIGTPAGAAPEIIEDGRNGYLVPHEDPQAMADAIVRVARMPEPSWRTLSDTAYATASRYRWDAIYDIFEDALYRAVEKGRTHDQPQPLPVA